MSVDIPTGVDCDTGAIANIAFKADVTCTFVAGKPGLYTDRSQSGDQSLEINISQSVNQPHAMVGAIRVIDIGLPQQAIRLARESY